MRWFKRRQRVERYAMWWERCEARVNARLRRLNDCMRVESDRYSRRVKWIGLMLFAALVCVLCSIIIYNAFK